MSTYAVVNPATGETVRAYPTASDADVESFLRKAEEGFAVWSRTPVAERARLVARAADLLRERQQELAEIIVREMGKPVSQSAGEADFSGDILQFYADSAEQITADRPIGILGEGTAVVRPSPLGALLGIMPWNFPYYQVARFAGPNLINGNVILLKHAPQCPESAEALQAVFDDAGFPEGVYQNVRLTNEQAAAVIGDRRVAGVSLTGSERAGAAVAAEAGRHLKKVALELGGSDPFLVLSADDLDAVVADAVVARVDNSGQACNAAKRFIVVDELYDAFAEKFVAAMAEQQPGDPAKDENEMVGPLSSLAAAEKLEGQVKRAIDQGATALLAGERDGAWFPPMVLADVTPEMDAYREELFGPVGVLYRVADEAEAVALANDTEFGLGSYVYTTDPEQGRRVADAIEAGMVYVNVVAADSPELPFGGVKRSGTSRELGLLAADEFVNKKLIRTA